MCCEGNNGEGDPCSSAGNSPTHLPFFPYPGPIMYSTPPMYNMRKNSITLFIYITIVFGTDNIMWNIPSSRLNVRNTLHDHL